MRVKVTDPLLFRMALMCVSTDKAADPFKRTLLIEPTKGRVTATNGNRAFRAECLEKLPADDFPPPPGPLNLTPPAKWPRNLVATHVDLETGTIDAAEASYLCELTTENGFPAYIDSVFRPSGTGLREVSGVALDPTLLADLASTIRAEGVIFGTDTLPDRDRQDHPFCETRLRARFYGSRLPSQAVYDFMLMPLSVGAEHKRALETAHS